MNDSLTLEDMDKLYLVSRLVYNGEIEVNKAAEKLAGILENRPESNKITFMMYAGMRRGRTFHHSLNDEIIIYFLKRIAEEKGKEDLALALDAVYGYAGFKNSLGSQLPELEKACDELRFLYGISDQNRDRL